MLIDANYRVIAPVDHALLQPIISQCEALDWSDTQYNRAEKPLLEGRLIEYPFPISNPKRQRSREQLDTLRSSGPLLEWIRSLPAFTGHRWIRGEVAALVPGVTLGWHIDDKWFHAHCTRLHVPLITNDKCVQLWQGETLHMEVGHLYELNNRVLHSATNQSDKPRVHLILDSMLASRYRTAIDSGINPVRTEPVQALATS